MKKVIIVGLLASLGAILALAACWTRTRRPAPTLQVFSGAGLMHPMDELCRAYSKKTGVNVQLSYGGTGMLMGKLAAGQPCDVFIPGAAKYGDDAGRKGWVDSASVVAVVRHVPVLAVSTTGEAKVACLEDLARPGVRVGLGDAKACAIGRTADLILERNGLADGAKSNVRIRTPTVNQLVVYLVMGQIDAAIVWEDMIRLPEASGKLRAVPIPPEKNLVSVIAASRGTRSEHPEQAADFMRFLASSQARETWLKWGFAPCGG